jgi:hypothetical protein
MESTTFVVDPFKTADVFGNILDDFDIWDEDEHFKPYEGFLKEFDDDFFSEGTETAIVSSSEKLSSQEVGSPQKTQGRRSSRRASAKRPSLLRNLSKAELVVDENDKESSSINEQSVNSKGSNEDKSTSHSGREKSDRRSSRHLRSKSPSRRRPSSTKKEASMRNLVTILTKSDPDVQAGTEDDKEKNPISSPIVSKSVHHKGATRAARPKNMREMKLEHPKNEGAEHNLPDALPLRSDKVEIKSEPVRGKIERSNSIRARAVRLVAAEGEPRDGPKPTRRGDPTRSRSMNQRVDGRPVPRPTLSGGGLPVRSASFAIRRERSGNAVLDGVPKSKLATMAAAQESRRGEGPPAITPSLPGRGLSGRRSASPFAIRRERSGNHSALDDLMKSKLATIAASQGEQAEEQAATIPRDPTRGNLGRSASNNVGRRLPPSRNGSQSGKGLQRMARSIGGQSLHRSSSSRFSG